LAKQYIALKKTYSLRGESKSVLSAID